MGLVPEPTKAGGKCYHLKGVHKILISLQTVWSSHISGLRGKFSHKNLKHPTVASEGNTQFDQSDNDAAMFMHNL